MFKEELKLVPHAPGSYQMVNSDGIIIYVGKAKDLNKRLHSYFRGTVTGKTALMVSEVDHFKYIVTKTETESFILEINLIKKYNPKYNILLKDDKTYPYIEYIRKPYPALKVSRYINVKKSDKKLLFGPYPNAYAARRMVSLINRLYPLKKCEGKPKEVCLYYHIGECLGYCTKDIPEEKIKTMESEILSFLRGNDKIITDKIKEKIKSNSTTTGILDLIDNCRYYIKNNSKGHVVLRYLLYNCNNRIIKDQLALDSCSILSNLYLQFGCIPFEEMPYASSLINHNPTIYDLIDIVPIEGRNDELLAGYIKKNTEQNNKLYTSIDEVRKFGDIPTLVNSYNNKIYYKHKPNRCLVIENNNLYIHGYEDDTINIINKLNSLTNHGIRGYKASYLPYHLFLQIHCLLSSGITDHLSSYRSNQSLQKPDRLQQRQPLHWL